jgi:hypothetical protein
LHRVARWISVVSPFIGTNKVYMIQPFSSMF